MKQIKKKKKKKKKLKKEVCDKKKKKLGEIDIQKLEKFVNEGNNMERIKFQLLNCDKMYDETNEKLIEKIIEETKIEEIRKCKSNILNEIYCYISLFIGKEHMTKIQEKLREKVKIKIDNYDEEIKGNLTLYQSEEEALKLFPDFRHKEKPKEEDNKVKEQRVEKEEEK